VFHPEESIMSGKPVALVTGANKGIGYEISRQLARKGYSVVIGARDEPKGAEAAARLRDEGLDARHVRLDVTDADTIAALPRYFADTFGRLDVLVNNAGIARDWGTPPSATPLANIRETFETNVFGAIAVTQALLPLLRQSLAGRVVNVSSGLGSLTLLSDPAYAQHGINVLSYNASKTALNAFTVALAKELKDTSVKVNSADPDWVRTDMGGPNATHSVTEGADTPVWLATLPADGPTGGYFNKRRPLPW
jgi:NAD(P)-dependent dehydrogenase (short-subunit alcohol dehydrogenase family)